VETPMDPVTLVMIATEARATREAPVAMVETIHRTPTEALAIPTPEAQEALEAMITPPRIPMDLPILLEAQEASDLPTTTAPTPTVVPATPQGKLDMATMTMTIAAAATGRAILLPVSYWRRLEASSRTRDWSRKDRPSVMPLVMMITAPLETPILMDQEETPILMDQAEIPIPMDQVVTTTTTTTTIR